MTRRTFLAAAAAPAILRSQTRPSVVLILTDDQGWFDLGIHGNPHVMTPTIDSIAREGVRFSQFYASPVCSPTRAALMTGRHYQRTGAVDTFKGRDTLDASEITMGQVFQRHGYRTACIGKWHLGRYMKYHPNHRGFDEYFGFWQYGFMNRYDDSDELFDNKGPVETTGYITDVLTDRAVSFVEQNRKHPYFLYLPYNAPHAPYLLPDRYLDPMLKRGVPLQDARIYGMVNAVDDNVGRLLKAIDRDNTIVIFMTDNGGVSRHFKAGLRSNKGSVYEGGVRAPFFVRWPGKLPAGAVVDAMAQHIDVLPTVCDLAGAAAPGDRQLDGRSLARLAREGRGETPHRYLFHQWNRGRPVLETMPGDPELKANWAVRDAAGWKLHHNGELYDLARDPGEKTNVASAQPARAAGLRREFEQFHADVTGGRRYERVPIEVGREDENPVEIDLTWGDPAGGKVTPTYRHYNRDTIENWTIEGDAVRWKIEATRAGDYEVILKYGCEPGQQGSRLRIECGRSRVDHTVEATPGRMVFRQVPAGRLTLERGPAELRFTAAQIRGRELMALHKIWLKRV